MQTIQLGQMLVCHETGKAFIAGRDGCSFNYATDRYGNTISDEGVDIRERRRMSDRTKPFFCYVSSDGRRVTGWKGRPYGEVFEYVESAAGWHGGTIARFRVRDVHGAWWSGRGSGKGMACTLRPMKTPKGF